MDTRLGVKQSGSLIIFAYIASLIVQVVVLGVYLLMTGTEVVDDTATWIIMIGIQIAFFMTAYMYLQGGYRIKFFEVAGFKNKLTQKQLLIIFGLSITLLFASAPLAMIFSDLISRLGYSSSNTIPSLSKSSNIIVGFVVLCVCAPIGEEFLYRNSVMRGLKQKGMFYAMIMSSVIFSLAHGNIQQLVHQFFVGCCLSYVFLVSGNLKSAILLHSLNNFLALGLELIPSVYTIYNYYTMPFMVIIGFIVLVMLLSSFWSEEKKKHNIDDSYRISLQRFGATIKLIGKFIADRSYRAKAVQRFNNTLYSYEHNQEKIEEGLSIEMRDRLVKQNLSTTSIKVAIIFLSIVVLLSFGMGFYEL